MTDLFNRDEKAGAGMEKDRLFATYVQYARGLSDHRQNQFAHFITIHLFLLPAHAALLSKTGFDGMVYSILVAVLGVTICIVSYRLIRDKFARIDASYRLIHTIEQQMPFRFFTALAEAMGDGKHDPDPNVEIYRVRVRKTELGFIRLVGVIYASMPIVHYNMPWLSKVLGQ